MLNQKTKLWKGKEIRDTIKTIENLLIKQKMDSKYQTNEEYIGIKTDTFSCKDLHPYF